MTELVILKPVSVEVAVRVYLVGWSLIFAILIELTFG